MGKKKNLLRGFARVQLVNPDGSIAHETGFENTFTNPFRNTVLTAIGVGSGAISKPAYIGIGTGTAPATDATSLNGMLATMAAADSTVSGSSRLRLTCSFASDANTGNISNMGLYTSNTSNAGLVAGNTFSASFAKASNQELSVTYDITFAS